MSKPMSADDDLLTALQAVARLQNWRIKRIGIGDDATTRTLTLSLSRPSSGAVQAELDLEGVDYQGVEFAVTNNGTLETSRERAIREGTGGGSREPYEGQEVTDEESGTTWTFFEGKWIDKARRDAARGLAAVPLLTSDERDQLWPDPEDGQEYVDPGSLVRYVYWDGAWIPADQQQPVTDVPTPEPPPDPAPVEPLASSRRRR